MRARVTEEAIEPARLVAAVARNANGATVLFLGTVRDVNEGRAVTGIEYAAYRAMAIRELDAIVTEATRHFGTEDIVVEHRTGELSLGECSVAVAAAHPRRAQAFDAARFVVEELKRRVPIWKLEHHADGSREWVNAASGVAEQGQAVGPTSVGVRA